MTESLEKIGLFVAVYEERSFSAAAKLAPALCDH